MPDESALGERVTLVTICLPRKTEQPAYRMLFGGAKPEGFAVRLHLKDTGDPAIVGLLRQKPLRPVVLRPHLSAGLPLNSLFTMHRGRCICKVLFYPISSSVSACSTASGVPQTTTTSPSLNRVSAPGSRPTMPSRRTSLTAAREPRAASSAMLRPTAQA